MSAITPPEAEKTPEPTGSGPAPTKLDHGPLREAVAAALLETGRSGFVLWKCGLISLALLLLTIHKNFAIARAGLKVSAVVYTVLCLYHLSLFWV